MQNDWIAGIRARVQDRIDLAKRLKAGESGGSDAEAVFILSALMSSIAANLWPGEKRDRKRFVELWACHAKSELNPNLISVPLLIAHLDAQCKTDLAAKVRNTRPGVFLPADVLDARVVTGGDVDQDEASLRAQDKRLAPDLLRRFSYGNLFYKHIRSGYVHHYHTTEFTSPWPQAIATAPISYVNFFDGPSRRIYIDIGWFAELVESVSASAVPLLSQAPLPDPARWWVMGG